MHRDRLARIGADLLEFIFDKAGAKLVVLGSDEGNHHDLADDLLAVTTVFVARPIMDAVRRKINDDAPRKLEKRAKKTYENPVRARRIRLHPTAEQKKTLSSWMGAVRFCYNLLVAKFGSQHANLVALWVSRAAESQGRAVPLGQGRRVCGTLHLQDVWIVWRDQLHARWS